MTDEDQPQAEPAQYEAAWPPGGPAMLSLLRLTALCLFTSDFGVAALPLCATAPGDVPRRRRGEGRRAAPPPWAGHRPDAWGPATTACRCPRAALRPHPTRALLDRPWTRAGMGDRIASRPHLCSPVR